MHRSIALAAEKATEALIKGTRILILGGRTTNFPDHLRSNAHLEFWDSTDPDTRRTKSVPDDIGVVLFVRFNSHALTDRVHKDCVQIGVPFIGPLGNGQITKVIEDVFAEIAEDARETSDTSAARVDKPDYSELPVFLIDQIPSEKLGLELLDSEEELTRLHGLAIKKWPSVSTQRVRRALRHMLYELGLLETRANEPEADVEELTRHDPAKDEQIKQLEQQLENLRAKLGNAKGEERRQKEEVRKLEQDLRDRERDLRFITRIAADIMILLDRAGIIPNFRSETARDDFDRIYIAYVE